MTYIYPKDISYALLSRRMIEQNNKICVIHKCRRPEYLKEETWLHCQFSDKYLISSWGRVFRLFKNGTMVELKGSPSTSSIPTVRIKTKKYPVKKLVANCFGAEGHGEVLININRDQLDNKIDNLLYIPQSKNKKHQTNRDFTRLQPVTQYTLSGMFVQKWRNADEAAKFLGFRSGDILMCAEGEVLTAHDFIWVFSSDEEFVKRLPGVHEKISQLKPFIITGSGLYSECEFATIAEASKYTGLPEYEIMKRCVISDNYPDWSFSYSGKSYKRSEIIWKEKNSIK